MCENKHRKCNWRPKKSRNSDKYNNSRIYWMGWKLSLNCFLSYGKSYDGIVSWTVNVLCRRGGATKFSSENRPLSGNSANYKERLPLLLSLCGTVVIDDGFIADIDISQWMIFFVVPLKNFVFLPITIPNRCYWKMAATNLSSARFLSFSATFLLPPRPFCFSSSSHGSLPLIFVCKCHRDEIPSLTVLSKALRVSSAQIICKCSRRVLFVKIFNRCRCFISIYRAVSAVLRVCALLF